MDNGEGLNASEKRIRRRQERKPGQTRVMNGQELGALRGGVDANWWAWTGRGTCDNLNLKEGTTSLDWLIRLIRLSEGCLGPWTDSGQRVG